MENNCVRCKSPGNACICGEHSFELGRIFAAHSLLSRAATAAASDDEMDQIALELGDTIDDAEKYVRRRALAQLGVPSHTPAAAIGGAN